MIGSDRCVSGNLNKMQHLYSINNRRICIDKWLLPWLPGVAAGCSGVAMAAVWVELLVNAEGISGGGGGGAGGI